MGQLSVSLFKHTPKIFWYFQKFKTSERLSFNIQSTFQYLWRLFISPQKTFFTPSCNFLPPFARLCHNKTIPLHVLTTFQAYSGNFDKVWRISDKPWRISDKLRRMFSSFVGNPTSFVEYPTRSDEYPTSLDAYPTRSDEYPTSLLECFRALTNIRQALSEIQQAL